MITVNVTLIVPWLPRENKHLSLGDKCTVAQMLEVIGIGSEQHHHILVAVNGRNILPGDKLRQGDSITVLPVMCGG